MMDTEHRAILAEAEDAIRESLDAARLPRDPCPEREASGLFVTIHVDGKLRGCIGFLEIQVSFVATLREVARRAAHTDPRFPSISADEVDNMQIDVTLLGPLEELEDPEHFDIGLHGLVIEAHGRRGLLLPQVAVDHGWSHRQFLEAVARKALLPENAWKHENSRLYRFEGIVLKGATLDE
ncbi:AmmeMemoRadiSam system protein A [bacterium]|nr:AmmeMemoRadiSam system protein A [bacterium]